MIRGLIVAVEIIAALAVCFGFAAIFILATDRGDGCCRLHEDDQ